ncbi:hypothetical protein B0H63DRAFT_468018 [Podospora didyma]|uniref:histidine kinase n=1 Tax=Podospora didyma TaxID=330526 RepID=A0AAE0U0Y8_9PEZI|nr:hypothetical protein B0H63DRAFT_468018 [Podospora didyma]
MQGRTCPHHCRVVNLNSAVFLRLCSLNDLVLIRAPPPTSLAAERPLSERRSLPFVPLRAMEETREFSFETASERDLYQYFAPDQTPRSGPDTTLSAFAQLVALRLNATRVLISLVDRVNQYILTEATQASDLLRDPLTAPGDDGLLLGQTTLPRAKGLCGSALEVLHPAQEDGIRQKSWRVAPLIVNDLTKDPEFKDHPFVTDHPSLRFFAAMPISTKSGFNIGTISVLDDNVREGLTQSETKLLRDMGLTIMNHLIVMRTNESHRLSEKMIKGLSVFIEGRTDLDDWWLELGNHKPQVKKKPPSPKVDLTAEIVKEEGSETSGSPPLATTKATEPYETDASSLPDAKNPAVPAGLSSPTFPLLPPSLTRAMTAPPPKTHPYRPPPGDVVLIARTSDAGRSRRARSYRGPKSARSVLSDADANAQVPISRDQSRGQTAQAFVPTDIHESIISRRLREMFSRASHIIQECIEADGAIFLDAAVSTQSGQSEDETSARTDGTDEESTDSSGAGDSDAGSQTKQAGRFSLLEEDPSHKPCRVLGLWTGENSSLHGDKVSQLAPLTEAFLQRLLQKYPQGHVFSADEGRRVLSNSHHEDSDNSQSVEEMPRKQSKKQKRHPKEPDEFAETQALLGMLPGTRSIAFVPLWDSHRDRWFAGSFTWTVQQTTRVLTRTDDLDYLAAFGNSIMAEVARLDVVGADRAKSDFISSISHELRSPLHGILASVEFLQDTTVDLFQNGMIDTIERCGRTLLDTIQHVLDFAKINNFTGTKRRGKEKKALGESVDSTELTPDSDKPGLSVNVDLSLLTEDVVDSVFAGHEFQGNSNSSRFIGKEAGFPTEGLRRSGASETDDAPTSESKKESIDVVLEIDWRQNWTYNTQSGALRRVLMNLFGNALKYTDSGWVKVSLKAVDIEPTPSEEPAKSIITISVSDTGRGIEQEYLHSRLFTPFTQENSLNPGTGLGLSIVLQIVRSLGGTINITSEQGVGTKVVVTLTLAKAPPGEHPALGRDAEVVIQSAREKTKGLTIGLMGLNADPRLPQKRGTKRPTLETETSLVLGASIERATINWFGMKIAPPSTWVEKPPDFFIANENPGLRGAFTGVPTIVLCSHEALYREYSKKMTQGSEIRHGGMVHFVSKPCGPHKLAKAFAFCLGKGNNLPFSGFGVGATVSVPPSIASPQSLFRKSPEEYMARMGQMSDDYFPVTPPPPGDFDGSPTAESSIDYVTMPRPAAAAAVAERQKPLLLLVEDNEINLQLLSTFVRKSKYEYVTAMNGLEALKACQRATKPFDIIFMDISMPVMDGMVATREIRKLERSQKQKPAMVIALTGLGSADSQREAFSNGINVFLTKPVRFKDLRRILEEWVPNDAAMQPSTRTSDRSDSISR